MTSFAETRDAHRQRRETVRILADPELLEEHSRLDREIAELMARPTQMLISRTDDVDALRARLAELETQISESCTEMTLQAIGRQRWLTLIGKHPPTKTQRADGWQYNRLTFPAAALHASIVEPEITFEDAVWLSEELNIADFDRLWAVCELVNVGTATLPKSLTATVLRLSSDGFSTTAAAEASPEASS